MLMKSDKMQGAMRCIIDYENSSLKNEDTKAVVIYWDFTKLNNKIVIFYVIIINIVSLVWYILGVE